MPRHRLILSNLVTAFALLLSLGSANAAFAPLDHIAMAAGGSGHACAVSDTGRLACWGSNFGGALGDGTTSGRTTATFLPGVTGATMAAIGAHHTCAVIGGAAKCWGYNANGQVGDGSTVNRTAPVSVSGLGSGVTQVATGSDFSCALANGGVKCWGYGGFGQLGNGGMADSLTPVGVSGLGSGVSTITAGFTHACALLASGAAKCWGSNSYGEAGDGSFTARSTPVAVTGLGSGVSQIVAATIGYHTCAIVNGAAKCWGKNDDGEIGDTTHFWRGAPVAVSGLGSGVLQLAAANRNSCARLTAGTVKCWGNNQGGAIGDDSFAERDVPTAVKSLGGTPSWIGAGIGVGYALIDGRLRGWGCASCLLLSNDFDSIIDTPVPVAGAPFTPQTIAASVYLSCAIGSDGGVRCWGYSERGQTGTSSFGIRKLPTPVSGLSAISRLALGRDFACAGGANGTACWGANYLGQLGDGTLSDRATPLAVSGIGTAPLSLAAGYASACAVTANGAAKCWGDNAHGQLGDGSTTQRSTAVNVSSLGSGVRSVAVGGGFGCALLVSGGVRCWGQNSRGQLGDGSTTERLTPVTVSGLSNIAAITAGLEFACAITNTGAMSCWGANDDGQLGDNSHIDRATPVAVTGLSSGVSAISGQYYGACAITASGPRCWGRSITQAPAAIAGLPSASAIARGFEHDCAIDAGVVRCWGYNTSGEIGNGQSGSETLPIDLLTAAPDAIFADGFQLP